MNENILNLTQHKSTPEQIAAGVVEPEPDVKELIQRLLTFDVIPTTAELRYRARDLAQIAVADESSTVLIGGAPYFMSSLERALRDAGVRAYYAYSRRDSVEAIQEDGSVKKVQVFKHMGFIAADQ